MRRYIGSGHRAAVSSSGMVVKYGYISIVPIHPLKAVTSLKSAVKKFHAVAGIGRRHSKSSSFPCFFPYRWCFRIFGVEDYTEDVPSSYFAWVVVAGGEDVDI